MASHFDFLRHAKPASLYKLLERLPLSDAAVALAGLPASVGVQVMAYFPENRQEELMRVLRQARREGHERAAAVASRIGEILAAAKKSGGDGSGGTSETARPAAGSYPSAFRSAPPPQDACDPPPPKKPPPPPVKPIPWVPRDATSSPINGPALPGKPPSPKGDPLSSPLACAELAELLGRARDTLLPKGRVPHSGDGGRQPLPKSGTGGAGRRPPAVEGRIPSGRVETAGLPRVIGPRGKAENAGKPDGGGARRMDGKAVLAAILREAGGAVRENVRHEDPALFKELRSRMFHFDDLMRTETGSLARVFTVAPAIDASLALRFAAPALRNRVLRAVSPGRAAALRDVKPGRAGVDAIEAAQKKVLEVALQLQAAGRILIDPRDPDLAGA